jgi:Cdc6-like AAA superfamily ATPase
MPDTPTSTSTAADEAIDSVADDALGFVPRYAVPLAKQITSTSMSDSLTIGIYGPWGSGKTSLMNLIRALVSGKQKVDDFVLEQSCVTVKYTAWKYAHEESLWRTLVNVILDELLKQADEHDEEKRRLRETLYGDVLETRRRLKINWPRLVGALVSITALVLAIIFETRDVTVPSTVQVTLAGLALGGAAVTAFGVRWTSPPAYSADLPSFVERLGDQANDIAQAFQVVDDVLTTHRRLQYIEQFAESFELIVGRFLNGRRLVIFVDDLDRCLPEKAVQVLEGIKLFLGVPGTVFVLGVDSAALAYAVELHYSQEHYRPDRRFWEVPGFISGSRYLEKIIQFPFHLPPMGESSMLASPLVAQLCESKADLRWLEIGIRGFAGNPRALKRFARIYRSRRSVIAADQQNLTGSRELYLAKLVVLQEHHQWTELVDLIVKYTVSVPPSLLRDGPLALLERAAADSDERDRILNFAGTGIMSQLIRFAADDALMRFLRTEPRYDAENIVDPLPLIQLGGGSEAEPGAVTEPSSLDIIMRDLRSEDLPTRAKSISVVRDMSPQSRRQLVERLLSEVAGQSQSENPDSAGLPLTIMAIQSLFEQGIEPDLLVERSDWFVALAAESEKRGSASRSREALVSLIAEIGLLSSSLSQIDQVEAAELLTDLPAIEDRLGTTKYVEAIAETIRRSSTPLTVGIFGKWGSGKTSFMVQLKERIDEWPGWVSVFVNAWTDEPGNAVHILNAAIVNTLGADAKDLTLDDTAQSDAPRNLSNFLANVPSRDVRLVIFVDDIDRRLPDFQIGMMEAIRNLLRVQGVITVIAADRDILAQAAKVRWGGADTRTGDELVDELIDISFVVAPDASVSRTMLHDLIGKDLSNEWLEVLARYLDPNPRKIKQFVNRYRLCVAVADQAGESVDPGLLSMITLIASRWPRLLQNPSLLVVLWKASYDRNLGERSELVHRAINETELLDADDLVSCFEQVPPATEQDMAHVLTLVGRALTS